MQIERGGGAQNNFAPKSGCAIKKEHLAIIQQDLLDSKCVCVQPARATSNTAIFWAIFNIAARMDDLQFQLSVTQICPPLIHT